ncbi:MAG: arsenite methyltransferase [Candidatus Atribacteria bacterium]|nr:MAG: arsenite methyltransferase [Candidatus Atribacteria bacterium]
MKESETIRKAVRERYGERARAGSSCCETAKSCSSPRETVSTKLGYSEQELGSIPQGADLGLGCGNPTALASLKPGETVLDLGSGGGIDCFLAANLVGGTGHVIGVDMTAAMIDRARDNARKNAIENVEFRLGEIEHLPVADGAVDVAISNCVVNLSPDKPQVFSEVYRVLKPGGRMMISDIVQLKPLPEAIRKSIESYVGCIAGASLKTDYLSMIQAAGFREIEILSEKTFDAALPTSGSARIVLDGQEMDPSEMGLTSDMVRDLAGSMASISVQAFK